ncbi:MAG: tRNA uridine(34) 5-carboxymethylaminomethyl modification radical SAM/GNAT enzyme Elp3 [Candidatus Magasanikbacteria bacterium CG10_big_fil_rev_8_21_14_0_10_36_32]|uniref:tRNA carboxymethyluridine synthase n=1 Tax=Candidatus Magasanikbacteria bacterium CG10_big_fil_rev_8_21_14_0_10_36_32 TaxID=1974646 RepID=A0A2M6W6D0_9BACT|nr:MAG: tRNA uridine(34) 5-carboxymethylaminomethyl modification radical SAM/GNAT enzyme Elp3 [Candidatus Magasanikbacteria bacterium CG10_big_fil_rev_8_21_14_0_10_36_32]
MGKIEEKVILLATEKIRLRRLNNAEQFNELKRFVLRSEIKSGTLPSTANLLKAYHNLVEKNKLSPNKILEKLLVKRAVRTLSGVSIVTVLTKPFPCPGKCVYCPLEKNMPKSYLSEEPAAARALKLNFDPFKQVTARLNTLEKNGHPTDKVELIVKGGTWNAYPINYQYWFILRCFEACNAKNQSKIKNQKFNSKIKINEFKKILAGEQKKNETAQHRIIGLTLETRPDFVTYETVGQMRELGCTRAELGVQTTDDKILKIIKRGHAAEDIKKAVKLLKQYGFKVDFHLMPQLPGSTPAKDLKMLLSVFSDSDYRPDMLKIYPCAVIKNSELYRWWKAGKFQPYSNKQLLSILKKFKAQVPYYVRISRLIRDVPGRYIEAGNKVTNLRQVIQSEMAAEKLKCKCLRCREIGHQEKIKNKKSKIKLFSNKYKSSGGMEYFLSFEDIKRQAIFAFCRLRIDKTGIYPAFIRELHVYGQSISVGEREQKASQHKGLGVKLIKEAEKICKKHKIREIAVISGVGVKNYYKKFGYKPENTYMIKSLKH